MTKFTPGPGYYMTRNIFERKLDSGAGGESDSTRHTVWDRAERVTLKKEGEDPAFIPGVGHYDLSGDI